MEISSSASPGTVFVAPRDEDGERIGGGRAERKACVIGWPVAHSRSPLIHGFWLSRYNVRGRYERRAVEPGRLPEVLRRLQTHGFCGANVTLPHKEVAVDCVDTLTESAQRIGAVNTVWYDNSNRLCGDNTDWSGFLESLDTFRPGWETAEGETIVIGAGGAARAIVYALNHRQCTPLVLVNRTPERAKRLANQLAPDAVIVPWSRLPSRLARCRLLINATAAGLTGEDLALNLRSLAQNAIVYDTLYTPYPTALSQQATQNDIACIDGVSMLLHQATLGFYRWFGVKPEITPELEHRVREDLNEAARAS